MINGKLILLVGLSMATIAIGLNNMPEEVDHTNAVGDAMINKFKRAFRMSSTQYANAKMICDYAARQITDQGQLAYVLATAVGESQMKPIKEIRARSGTSLRRLQDRYWGSGFYGRGYVQLTWDYNYKKFSSALGVNLTRNPNLALDPRYAAQIIVMGMKKGMFTGVGLSRFISGSKQDFKNARKIVNGLDKASTFAGYATKIMRA